MAGLAGSLVMVTVTALNDHAVLVMLVDVVVALHDGRVMLLDHAALVVLATLRVNTDAAGADLDPLRQGTGGGQGEQRGDGRAEDRSIDHSPLRG